MITMNTVRRHLLIDGGILLSISRDVDFPELHGEMVNFIRKVRLEYLEGNMKTTNLILVFPKHNSMHTNSDILARNMRTLFSGLCEEFDDKFGYELEISEYEYVEIYEDSIKVIIKKKI